MSSVTILYHDEGTRDGIYWLRIDTEESASAQTLCELFPEKLGEATIIDSKASLDELVPEAKKLLSTSPVVIADGFEPTFFTQTQPEQQLLIDLFEDHSPA